MPWHQSFFASKEESGAAIFLTGFTHRQLRRQAFLIEDRSMIHFDCQCMRLSVYWGRNWTTGRIRSDDCVRFSPILDPDVDGVGIECFPTTRENGMEGIYRTFLLILTAKVVMESIPDPLISLSLMPFSILLQHECWEAEDFLTSLLLLRRDEAREKWNWWWGRDFLFYSTGSMFFMSCCYFLPLIYTGMDGYIYIRLCAENLSEFRCLIISTQVISSHEERKKLTHWSLPPSKNCNVSLSSKAEIEAWSNEKGNSGCNDDDDEKRYPSFQRRMKRVLYEEATTAYTYNVSRPWHQQLSTSIRERERLSCYRVEQQY